MTNKNNTSEYTSVAESTEESEYTSVVESTEQSEYSKQQKANEKSEYTETSDASENSEYTEVTDQAIASEYTEQSTTSEDNQIIEDHDVIHARMVKIFRKLMIIFSIALLIVTAIVVCCVHVELSTALGFFAFSIVFPAFIYKISIKSIRNYPL